MKRTEFVQIKTLSIKELADKAKVLKKEIAELGFNKNMKKLKDLKIISKKRKERAQILTVIGQKELLAELESRVKSLVKKRFQKKKRYQRKKERESLVTRL